MKRERLVRMALACLVGLIMAAVIAWMTIRHDQRQAAGVATNVAPASIGGPFTLTTHDGRVVTDKDFVGKYKLVFFGYTFCPDICPTELQTIAQAMDLMGDSGADVQPLFITIDPERDTPPVLADYVKLFHPSIIGLTGTAEQIAAVAKAYRVYYARSQGEPDPTQYLMDHSTFAYLLAPDGSFVTVFAKGSTPEQMVEAINAYRSRGR
ncbi:SCO family protein [Niveispirillum cyanobacteriorum]|uniref:SCO family protein n=1 Tax=Niveispirillum cyanobacteriorum TaxID=1612173 RepID=A0A2K9NCQ8_9PROT|nr:SCO family protein [Niveispirillum cyanobacteriorum]AUN29965.1 SCO family protein [Niveispirillum cyanobacteriorum]GGE59103.1 protein senC [Niveispirillum cyanobacteriorum]